MNFILKKKKRVEFRLSTAFKFLNGWDGIVVLAGGICASPASFFLFSFWPLYKTRLSPFQLNQPQSSLFFHITTLILIYTHKPNPIGASILSFTRFSLWIYMYVCVCVYAWQLVVLYVICWYSYVYIYVMLLTNWTHQRFCFWFLFWLYGCFVREMNLKIEWVLGGKKNRLMGLVLSVCWWDN